MIGSAGSFWLLVLTSSSDANSALSHFGIVHRAVGNPCGNGGRGGEIASPNIPGLLKVALFQKIMKVFCINTINISNHYPEQKV